MKRQIFTALQVVAGFFLGLCFLAILKLAVSFLFA